MDREAASAAIVAFLRALGHAPEGDLADTGRLVAEAWSSDLLGGAAIDPVATLRDGAVASGVHEREGMVALRDLSVFMMCPHHLLPALGHADVIYRPGPQVAGFGAVVKALRGCTRKLTLQERAGAELCHALVHGLEAEGALCRLRMTHTCLAARGPRETRATVETLAVAGSFRDDPEAHRRAMALLSLGGTGS
ncbi:MAG: GTP cyclohydrolase I [Myxococcota bacterium]